MHNTNVPRASIAQAIHQEFMNHIEDIELSVELAEKATDNVLAVLDKNSLQELPKASRVEVVNYDEGGRVFARWGIRDVAFSVQDEGRTLKVFIGASTTDPRYGE